MLNHHPTTVNDRSTTTQVTRSARMNSVRAAASCKRTATQLRTEAAAAAMCNLQELHRRSLVNGCSAAAAASLFERRRITCSDVVFPPSPLYPGRIPLPLPRLHESALISGTDGYPWPYPGGAVPSSPSAARLNDSAMIRTRSDVDVVAQSSVVTPSFRPPADTATPLSAYIRGSSSTNRCPSSTHSAERVVVPASAQSLTSVTPSTMRQHVADSGFATRRRPRQRPRVSNTPPSGAAVASRLHGRGRHRWSLFTVASARERQACSDDSSTTSDEPQRPVSSTSSVVRANNVVMRQLPSPRYHVDEDVDVADSTSVPTSDSAYSDADDVPDVAWASLTARNLSKIAS